MRRHTYTTWFTRAKLVTRIPAQTFSGANRLLPESENLVTDSLIVQGNSYTPNTGAALSESASSSVVSHTNAEPSKVLDLRESLEWLLGSDGDIGLSHEKKSANRERRVDLLIWLLNLESRLGPYEPA